MVTCHLAVKKATYIASLFHPHMDRIEDIAPDSNDVLYFDVSTNVQKAANMLQAIYKRGIVLHGAEHVLVSLFFDNICKLLTLNKCIKL